jgi:hypothetical protein
MRAGSEGDEEEDAKVAETGEWLDNEKMVEW